MTTSATSAAPASSPGASEVSQPDGNSAADSNDHEREPSAAPSTPARTSPKKPQAKQEAKTDDDDPEWDFGNGKRAKRSEVRKRMAEVQTGAQKAWKERQEFEQRYQARDARLKELGIDVELFEKDPKAAFRKAAQEELSRQLDESTRDPRELAAEAAQRRAEEAEAKLKEHEETQKKQAYQKEVSEHFDKIAQHFATALQEHGLPAQPKSVWLMASLLQAARKKGERVSLAELARRTKEGIDGDLDHYLPEADGSALAKRLGPKRLEAIRLHLLAEHDAKFNPKPQQKREPEPKVMTSRSNPGGYITVDQMLAASRKR